MFFFIFLFFFFVVDVFPSTAVSCCPLQTLEQEASADYGDDGALWPLKDKCVATKTGGYEYRVCPFKDAHQEEGKSKVWSCDVCLLLANISCTQLLR